jgi:hypothetical protein
MAVVTSRGDTTVQVDQMTVVLAGPSGSTSRYTGGTGTRLEPGDQTSLPLPGASGGTVIGVDTKVAWHDPDFPYCRQW